MWETSSMIFCFQFIMCTCATNVLTNYFDVDHVERGKWESICKKHILRLF